MITISNLAMQFGGSVLFKQVDLQFVPGNCYQICCFVTGGAYHSARRVSMWVRRDSIN